MAANVQALAQGEHATDTFTVRVTDEHGASDTQTVTVDVYGSNDAPIITDSVLFHWTYLDEGLKAKKARGAGNAGTIFAKVKTAAAIPALDLVGAREERAVRALHRLPDAAGPPDTVDGPEMMFMAFGGANLLVHVNAEGCAIKV